MDFRALQAGRAEELRGGGLMADNEKSSSLAATAKGTAPSIYKNYSSFPPIFQAPDQQTEEEMRLGLLYDEGNQGEVYNPDYLYGGENYPSLRILWLGGAIDSLKRGQKPPLLSFCDVFMVPGRRVLVVEKCVRHADIWRGKRRAKTTTPGYLSMKWTPRPISCSRRYRRFSRARKDSGSLQGGMRKRKRIGQNRNSKRREHLKRCSRLCRTYELKPLNA